MVAIRLKLDKDGKIAEAEHLYAAVSGPMLKNVETLRPGLASDVPAANRKSHDELIRIGAELLRRARRQRRLQDALRRRLRAARERHDHRRAERRAGPSRRPAAAASDRRTIATGQISTASVFSYIKSIGNRRVFAADPVTGLVMGLSQFHHPMDFTSYPTKAEDGTTVQTKRDEADVQEPQAVRPARRAHLQGRRRRQGARDRSDGLPRSAQRAERVGERARAGEQECSGFARGAVAEVKQVPPLTPPASGRGRGWARKSAVLQAPVCGLCWGWPNPTSSRHWSNRRRASALFSAFRKSVTLSLWPENPGFLRVFRATNRVTRCNLCNPAWAMIFRPCGNFAYLKYRER